MLHTASRVALKLSWNHLLSFGRPDFISTGTIVHVMYVYCKTWYLINNKAPKPRSDTVHPVALRKSWICMD